MEGVVIAVMAPAEQTLAHLQGLLEEKLQQVLHTIRLENEMFPYFSELRCIRASRGAWTAAKKETVYDAIADAVAAYIVKYEETALLRRLIGRQYGYDDPLEIGKILGYCRSRDGTEAAEEPPEKLARRAEIITRRVKAILTEAPYLNLDGLIHFRLPDYMEELREIAEYAIDEYVMDKQYQEFISLLKYFVFIQEAKIPAAHLMHKGGHEFVLLNDQMKPIVTESLDSSFTVEMVDKEYNFEDMIVSTLITVAPKQIYLHTREPELPVIKTIMQIFEGRAKLCRYCRLCKPVLGERGKQDKLYT